MKIETSTASLETHHGQKATITEAFLGVTFITEDGEHLTVSMRDSGFELNYSGTVFTNRLVSLNAGVIAEMIEAAGEAEVVAPAIELHAEDAPFKVVEQESPMTFTPCYLPEPDETEPELDPRQGNLGRHLVEAHGDKLHRDEQEQTPAEPQSKSASANLLMHRMRVYMRGWAGEVPATSAEEVTAAIGILECQALDKWGRVLAVLPVSSVTLSLEAYTFARMSYDLVLDGETLKTVSTSHSVELAYLIEGDPTWVYPDGRPAPTPQYALDLETG